MCSGISLVRTRLAGPDVEDFLVAFVHSHVCFVSRGLNRLCTLYADSSVFSWNLQRKCTLNLASLLSNTVCSELVTVALHHEGSRVIRLGYASPISARELAGNFGPYSSCQGNRETYVHPPHPVRRKPCDAPACGEIAFLNERSRLIGLKTDLVSLVLADPWFACSAISEAAGSHAALLGAVFSQRQGRHYDGSGSESFKDKTRCI